MSKPVQLVARFGQACLTIEPVEPHTGADIADLLNEGKAVEQGDEIMQWAEPPAEGGSVVARIISHDCQQATKVWEVVPKANCNSCLSTPASRDRQRVNDLCQWAWDLLHQNRLHHAEEVIGLAYTLLEASGDPAQEAFLVRTAHAQLAHLRGDETRSAALCYKALESARQAFGEPHVSTAIAESNLAEALSLCGRFAEARPHIDAAMLVFRDPASVNDQFSAERLAELTTGASEVEARIHKATSGGATVGDGATSERDPFAEPAPGDSVRC